MRNKFYLFFTLFFLLSSCDKLIEFSPYSAFVSADRQNTSEKNLTRLYADNDHGHFEPFRFALVSDSHLYFDELAKAVDHINKSGDFDFAIHGGDMTDGGLIKEFDVFQDVMKKLEIPYFTVIGNHDLLANGRSIYSDMYGKENYSLIYKECKFIFFNDVVWELNYAEPDFGWLRQELQDRNEFRHVFVIAHIPPWSDQFFLSYFFVFNLLMNEYNVTLSIHGHHHDAYEYANDTLPNGLKIMPNMVIGAPQKGSYRTVQVLADTVIFQSINF